MSLLTYLISIPKSLHLNKNKNVFWFLNKKRWFNSNEVFDEFIKKRYGELLHQCEKSSRKTLLKNNKIAAIIVLDQFSRHIYRNKNRRQITLNTLNVLSWEDQHKQRKGY